MEIISTMAEFEQRQKDLAAGTITDIYCFFCDRSITPNDKAGTIGNKIICAACVGDLYNLLHD